ncbi:competence type IV pilus major pilin ComGC [Marinilactibacillus sp. Marseille-P9653]|uniref:competence type IV pilus major pilin ComGC n=1 Tax=Marinilactibacillus sp. Marseille-P9653 TaxID=2866583 RepID=UPI001CE4630C|nr:competence type IV pilus major pilin ComGC [Marinilactibacillus sp. Marseille-P9653]
MKIIFPKISRKSMLKDEGFTLIEMSLVLFIISVLLLLIIPNIGSHQGTAKSTGDTALETVVQTQIDLYEIENKQKPTSLEVLKDQKYLNERQFDEVQKQFSIDSNGNLIKKSGG